MFVSDISQKQEALLLNDFYIDPVAYQVKMGKKEIDLTIKEFELLYLFVSKKGMVVRRSEILNIISNSNAPNPRLEPTWPSRRVFVGMFFGEV